MDASRTGLTISRRGAVGLLLLDRPPHNALTYQMRLEVRSAWEAFRDDESVKAVVVAGSGDSFSTGLDLEELAQDVEALSPEERSRRVNALAWGPRDVGLWKPVVAAVEGWCLAGGWCLAQMCDVRIAGASAQFGIPELRWAHPAVFAQDLASFVSLGVALELVLWPRRWIDASRAHEIGFVNEVVPDGQSLATALEWATEVAQLPGHVVEVHKRLLYDAAALQPQPDQQLLDALTSVHARAEAPLALQAFRNGQAPPWEAATPDSEHDDDTAKEH